MQLELEDIDILRSFHYRIRPTFGTAHFSFGELPHQFEDEIEHYLIMAFGLVVQFVGEVCKKGLQAGEEGVAITDT